MILPWHQEVGGGSAEAAVVMLHGVTRRAADWLRFTPRLADSVGWRAIDFPGHGDSGPSPGDYRVLDYWDQLEGLLSSLQHPAPVLVGHSLGAMVAALAAAHLAEPIAGVVLVDPPFSTMGERFRESTFYRQFEGMAELLKSPGTAESLFPRLREMPVRRPSDGLEVPFRELRDDASLRGYAEYLSRVDPRVLEPILAGQWLEGYDLKGVGQAIRCPVVLIQGDAACGGMLTDDDAERFAGDWLDCRRIRLDGAGHLIHLTHPEVLAAEIDRLLAADR